MKENLNLFKKDLIKSIKEEKTIYGIFSFMAFLLKMYFEERSKLIKEIK